MTLRPAGRIHVEYPESDGVLYVNRRSATGWCQLQNARPVSIELRIDGRQVGDTVQFARAGGPARGSGQWPTTSTGFLCEFDPWTLSRGEHLFEIVVRDLDGRILPLEPLEGREGEGLTARRIRVYSEGAVGPCYVSDVFVDIVGFCNLRCAMCPQGDLDGLKADRTKGIMPPRLFARLVDRLLAEEMIGEWINLYNWGDPLLHPRLDEMLSICTSRGLKPILSTNLAMPQRHVERMLNARAELLIVSISGVTQTTYGRNHRGGRIDQVLDNLELVAQATDAVGSVLVKYLAFNHNHHEIAAARDFAIANGFHFGVYRGAIPSAESFLVQLTDDAYADDVRSFVGEPAARHALTSCPQETTIIVDHDGNLEVCCVAWKNQYGESALAADLRSYLMRKLENRTCSRCLGTGYAFHKHFGVLEPESVSWVL